MMDAGDFWSRRKARVAAQDQAERDGEAARAEAEDLAVMADRPDAEVLDALGLPDPDSVAPGDDVSAFMARAVPAHLRRRALRVLWRSNPALANLDGLVDYGEDYTDAARAVPDLQTSYRVGKGLLRHVEKMAQADGADEEPPATEPDTPDAELPDAAPVALSEAPDVTQRQDDGPVEEAELADSPPPRRMAFSFAGQSI